MHTLKEIMHTLKEKNLPILNEKNEHFKYGWHAGLYILLNFLSMNDYFLCMNYYNCSLTEYIQTIMMMEESVQHVVMTAIQEVRS